MYWYTTILIFTFSRNQARIFFIAAHFVISLKLSSKILVNNMRPSFYHSNYCVDLSVIYRLELHVVNHLGQVRLAPVLRTPAQSGRQMVIARGHATLDLLVTKIFKAFEGDVQR